MAAHPDRAELAIAIQRDGSMASRTMYPDSRRPAPNVIGMDKRNEKRTAAVLWRPRKSPVVMVIPERETPGMIAIPWATPIRIAEDHEIDSTGVVPTPRFSAA